MFTATKKISTQNAPKLGFLEKKNVWQDKFAFDDSLNSFETKILVKTPGRN